MREAVELNRNCSLFPQSHGIGNRTLIFSSTGVWFEFAEFAWQYFSNEPDRIHKF